MRRRGDRGGEIKR